MKRLRAASGTEYELGKRLGSGCYAHVYACIGRAGAVIKRLRDDKDESLRHERAMLARVSGHPNVMALLDHGSCGSWYVMPRALCSLDKHMRTSLSSLPFRRAAQIKGLWTQLLRGLAHCHAARTIHRDLKPENVLVDTRGVLKLADFGMAAVGDMKGRRKLTKEAEYCTQWYRAPELLVRLPEYDAAVDVWSAGCVLGEMLFGGNALFVCNDFHSERKQLHVVWAVRGTPDTDARPVVKKALEAYGRRVPDTHFRKTMMPPTNRSPHASLFVPAAVDALERALCLDERQRPSAQELLQEPWLTSELPSPDLNE